MECLTGVCVVTCAGTEDAAVRGGPGEAVGSLAAAAYLQLEANADEAGASAQGGPVRTISTLKNEFSYMRALLI